MTSIGLWSFAVSREVVFYTAILSVFRRTLLACEEWGSDKALVLGYKSCPFVFWDELQEIQSKTKAASMVWEG
jgi:hypothetical protein